MNAPLPPFPSDAELQHGVQRATAAVKLFRYDHPALRESQATASRTYFQLESALWSLLPASVWTDDPHVADFFVLPHSLVANWIDIGDDKSALLKRYLDTTFLPVLSFIVHEQPFFNRSGGADHLLVYVMDTGPFASEEEGLHYELRARPLLRLAFERMTKVGYYGFKEEEAHVITHSGWRYARDIAMPMFHGFHKRVPPDANARLFAPEAQRRATLYFSGQTTSTGLVCSPHIRQWLHHYLARCGPRCSSKDMESAWFALCPAGIGCWGLRTYDAIERLAIPVILSDGMVDPFDYFLDWSGFSLKLNTTLLMTLKVADPLAELHSRATKLRSSCVGGHDTSKASCLALQDAQLITRLGQVRQWFLWDPQTLQSAWGLFLLELYCRLSRPGQHHKTGNEKPRDNHAMTGSGLHVDAQNQKVCLRWKASRTNADAIRKH